MLESKSRKISEFRETFSQGIRAFFEKTQDVVSLTNLLRLLYLNVFFSDVTTDIFGNLDQHHDLNIDMSMQNMFFEKFPVPTFPRPPNLEQLALPSPCFGRQNLTHKHPWPCP